MRLLQALRKRNETRDAANSLVKDFESFLELNKHVDAIRRKEKTRRAALKVVDLIDEVLNYICNSMPSGLNGVYLALQHH